MKKDETKKSELLNMAIACVIDDGDFSVETKTEILSLLFEYRCSALFAESCEKDGETA